MPSPPRRESETSAPGWGANGSPSMRMPLISSWGIHWSWRRASAVSLARGRVRPWDLTKRPSASCCVFRGRTLPKTWRGDRCGSCALAWPPSHRFGWRCWSQTLYISLQGSRLLDTQWTQRSPTRHWGFQLWSRAFVNSMGYRSLPPSLSGLLSVGPS